MTDYANELIAEEEKDDELIFPVGKNNDSEKKKEKDKAKETANPVQTPAALAAAGNSAMAAQFTAAKPLKATDADVPLHKTTEKDSVRPASADDAIDSNDTIDPPVLQTTPLSHDVSMRQSLLAASAAYLHDPQGVSPLPDLLSVYEDAPVEDVAMAVTTLQNQLIQLNTDKRRQVRKILQELFKHYHANPLVAQLIQKIGSAFGSATTPPAEPSARGGDA